MDLYGVNEIEIVEGQLLINVSYGGGCEQHDFLLISSNIQVNAEGDQIDAFLPVKSNYSEILMMFPLTYFLFNSKL